MNFYRAITPDGIYTLPERKECNDENYDLPAFISIKVGQGYKYTCPSCGKISLMENRGPTL